jgi:tetratricopeptide (TPR) repeat protein
LGAALKKRFGNLTSEGKTQVGAMIAAITYWFVHSSAEWFWQIPAVTLPAIVYLAMLVGPWQRAGSTVGQWSRQPISIGGALLAVVAIAAVAPLYIAGHYLAQSFAAANPQEALVEVERAQRFNPLSSDLRQYEAELATQTGDLGRAEDAYRKAISLNPEHFAPYQSLAEHYENRGDLAAALSFYRKSLALNPLEAELNQKVDQLEAEVEAG